MDEQAPELRLVIWPDEGLKTPVGPFDEVSVGTELVKTTADSMVKAMYHYQGVGLAAQQVGIPFQIFVMDSHWVEDKATKEAKIFINPRIVAIGDGTQQLAGKGEGCLSFPYQFNSPVRRYDRVELEWLDFDAKVHHQWFDGYEAIIVQHEIDHLMGYCFIDRLSGLKRDMAIRKARKIRRKYRKGFKAGIDKLKQAPRTAGYALKRSQEFEQRGKK